ncbi:hypothetical protein [Hydrocarboniphaga effusa]|uniref:hypothetical protein n=1 Tax=Hydrocarboniphaga effusa TaxID=243629 RepID=UPI003BAC0749
MALFKPWRERLKSDVVRGLPHLHDGWEREDQAVLVAVEVFGNYDDAMLWMLRESSDIAGFGWEQPHRIANASDAGRNAVIEHLRSIQPTITPQPPGPQPPARQIGKRRRKR